MTLWPDEERELLWGFRERSLENKKERLHKGGRGKEKPSDRVIKRWRDKLDRRNLERDK